MQTKEISMQHGSHGLDDLGKMKHGAHWTRNAAQIAIPRLQSCPQFAPGRCTVKVWRLHDRNHMRHAVMAFMVHGASWPLDALSSMQVCKDWANVRRCTPALAPHVRCNLEIAGGMQRSHGGQDTANGKVQRQTGEQMDASGRGESHASNLEERGA
jgi:hypothetical protein